MKSILSLIILSLTFLFINPVYANPFYEGKVVTIIVNTNPGGGTDFYGRLVSQFIKKYLPKSTVIVKNIPGAGGLIGLNELYRSKPDGLTIGTFNRANGIAQLVGLKGVTFDFPKLNWLGSAASELSSFIVRSDIYKNLDEALKADKLRIATDGLGTLSNLTPLLFYQMLGKTNYVTGNYGGGETDMAVIRREMDASFGSFYTSVTIIEQGYAIPVMFIGQPKPAGYEKVPLIQDVITDPKHKPVVDLLIGLNSIGRPFAAPPGIPDDRLKILRQAFEKTVNDPELQKVAEKVGRPAKYVGYKECEAWSKGLFNLRPDVVNTVKRAFTK